MAQDRLGAILRSLAQVAGSDPAWAVSLTGNQRADAAEAIAKGMPQRDAAGAFAWAKQLPEGKVRDSALESALRWGASRNPEQLREILAGVDLPDKALAASRWVVNDSEAAIAVLDTPDLSAAGHAAFSRGLATTAGPP